MYIITSHVNDQQQTTLDTVIDNYVLYNVIGHGCGGTAKVNIAEHSPTETILAVKRLKLEQCQYDLSVIQVGYKNLYQLPIR